MSTPFGSSGSAGRPEMRISDAEREAAATALGEHYAAGRLTKEEYDERAAVAYAATHRLRAAAAVRRPAGAAPVRRRPVGARAVRGVLHPAAARRVGTPAGAAGRGAPASGCRWSRSCSC